MDIRINHQPTTTTATATTQDIMDKTGIDLGVRNKTGKEHKQDISSTEKGTSKE